VAGDCFTARLSYEHRFAPEEIAREADAAGFTVAEYQSGTIGIAVLRPRAVGAPERDAEAATMEQTQ
jgi:hypothetical protein